MKKTFISVLLIWGLLSVILFFLLSNVLIISPLNQFNEGLASLQQKQKIYELDFEQVYLHDDYLIYPKDNLIAVKLGENDCGLVLYYNQNKEYVDSEIVGDSAFTNNRILNLLWFLVGVLSICLAIAIILIVVMIIKLLKKSKCRISVNKE